MGLSLFQALGRRTDVASYGYLVDAWPGDAVMLFDVLVASLPRMYPPLLCVKAANGCQALILSNYLSHTYSLSDHWT